MHTMHHRKSLYGSSDPSSTTTVLSDGVVQQQQRKRKKQVSSSSSFFTNILRNGGGSSKFFSTKNTNIETNDIMIIIMTTCLVTVFVILLILKLYTSLMAPSFTLMNLLSSSSSLIHNKIPITNSNHNRKITTVTTTDMDTESGNENHHEDDDSILPWNELYRIPNSMNIVGDRSDRYVQLRMEIDTILPVQHYDRSYRAVQQLTKDNPYTLEKLQVAVQQEQEQQLVDNNEHVGKQQHNSDQVMNPTYDIYNCPDQPPEGYPYAWNMMTILQNWSPDDVKPPSSNIIYQGLCIFDYQQDYHKAITYRDLELPFVVINDPSVAETVERWNHPGYIQRLMGTAKHRTEYSENNHFMYYVPPPKNQRRNMNTNRLRKNMNTMAMNQRNLVPADWKAPTQMLRMSYMEWLSHANVTDDTMLGPDHPHWYYRLIGCGGTGNDGSCDKESSEYLFDELPFFQPRESQLYIVDPEEQKGIHCRFGMKGVIAENHFDGSRNFIVVLGGSRRYMLSHPNQCEHLALYPKGHPSSRHSAVDWSNPNLEDYPQFAHAMGNEIVLTAGQVLYLPTEWFHYIVSLELNYQCNTRSGITKVYRDYIRQCGF